jgi:hypothetical protein
MVVASLLGGGPALSLVDAAACSRRIGGESAEALNQAGFRIR